MIDKNLMSPEKRALAEMLEAAAQQVDASPSFKNELEKKLMNAHRPKTGLNLFSVKKLASTVGWTIGWVVIALIFVWVVRTISPQPQPAAGNTPFPNAETATPENAFDYTVKEGDTCGMLADKYGTTIEELMAVNGLKECKIFIGQVLKIPIKNEAPPSPQPGGFDWHGTTIYLNASFPETPPEMKVYLAKEEQRAAVEDARTLAGQFGMSGNIYRVFGEVGGTEDYLVVDGNRQLRVRSDRYFSYYPDYAEWTATSSTGEHPEAERLINEFMQSHGFTLEYKVEYSELFGGYSAMPVTPDGFVYRFEFFKSGGLFFRFNGNGLVMVDASLLKYDEAGTISIISAEQAWQKILNPDTIYGINEGTHSSSTSAPIETWVRARPMDETITIYGWLSSTGKSIDGGAPLVTLDGYTVTGSIADIDERIMNTFIEATGQFHSEDGVKTFVMESWKPYDGHEEGYQGSIQGEGNQVVMTTPEGLRLVLPDFPTDIVLPVENMFVLGVTRGDVFEWKSIDSRMQGGGGGGGGGSGGFFKINLTGTPVPIPTPAPPEEFPQTIPPDAKFIEGLRGILSINIYQQADGTERTEYGFLTNPADYSYGYILLEGDSLEDLKNLHNRPVDIWGEADRINENGMPVIKVERFEVPFPDLQFQLIRGTQKVANLDGQSATLFTAEDGRTYVQLFVDGTTGESLIGNEGDPVILEALAIPDETFGGYPGLRVFGGGPAADPVTGNQLEMSITADKPIVMPEMSRTGSIPPTASIEDVELVYFIPDQRYLVSDPASEPSYLQPIWRFSGHYNNGDEFEILVQALKDQFLLPEIQDMVPPG